MDTVMSYYEAKYSQRFPAGMANLPEYNNLVANDSKGNFILNIYRKDNDSLLGTTFTNA
ncbi:hypothetical protein DPMN_152657 [Dreissena polymorpha]|uniref:Uncharacterized protein n=1 Tax=Dreissena polymorpha TaxID=45954 RepID=A0A9D4J7J3_DREPO|nr:hypothetical protein DPMN_152657 [Dreissena polymorpha]